VLNHPFACVPLWRVVLVINLRLCRPCSSASDRLTWILRCARFNICVMLFLIIFFSILTSICQKHSLHHLHMVGISAEVSVHVEVYLYLLPVKVMVYTRL
jgi:hypothetical protein